jgi:hypothetical protein
MVAGAVVVAGDVVNVGVSVVVTTAVDVEQLLLQ